MLHDLEGEHLSKFKEALQRHDLLVSGKNEVRARKLWEVAFHVTKTNLNKVLERLEEAHPSTSSGPSFGR